VHLDEGKKKFRPYYQTEGTQCRTKTGRSHLNHARESQTPSQFLAPWIQTSTYQIRKIFEEEFLKTQLRLARFSPYFKE